jgi:hypothetical protein
MSPDGTPDPTSPFPGVWFPKFLTAATDGTHDWFMVGDGTPDHPTPHLQRFHTDGAPDSSFTIGQTSGSAGFSGINLILPAPDNTGDIYVAGSFTTYNGVQVGHIARINANGTLEQGG